MADRYGYSLESISSLVKRVERWWEKQNRRWSQPVSRYSAVSEPAAIAALKAGIPRQRWEAAANLARSAQRSSDAVVALVEVLSDPEPFVRWQAVEALAAQEAGRVFPVLSDLLSDTDPLRRAGAAEALGRIGGEGSCAELCKAADDADAEVRAAVARALGECGAPPCVGTLVTLLRDEHPEVSRAAARALGRVGSPSNAAEIAAELERAEQPLLVRRSLAAALAKVPHPEARPTLLAALADPDPQVRGYAAQGLGEIGNEEAAVALRELASDTAPVLHGTVGDIARKSLASIERHRQDAAGSQQDSSTTD